MNSQSTDNGERRREDPIHERYYRPWEISEAVVGFLFWVAAILSFAAIFVDKAAWPRTYSAVLTGFAVAVMAYFTMSLANRLYFSNRAEHARREEFISDAFGVGLTHERTVGYYNNEERDPDRRLAMDVLENTFFTKNILRKMAPALRLRTSLYLFTWMLAAIWRDTPIDWIVAGTQVLFSEELLSKWLRLEWLRMKAEAIYGATYKIIRSDPSTERLRALATEAFADYEAAKSASGILLSKVIFERLNPALSPEWDNVRRSLSSSTEGR